MPPNAIRAEVMTAAGRGGLSGQPQREGVGRCRRSGRQRRLTSEDGVVIHIKVRVSGCVVGRVS